MGNFNSKIMDKILAEFCQLYNLKHLIKMPTCKKQTFMYWSNGNKSF